MSDSYRRTRSSLLAVAFWLTQGCGADVAAPSSGLLDASIEADAALTDDASFSEDASVRTPVGGADARAVSDGGESDGGPVPLRATFSDETVRKVEPLPTGALLFREPLGGELHRVVVQRSLAWLDADGAVVHEERAAEDEQWVDAVAHPSGEVSLFVVKGAGCSLRRYDTQRKIVHTLTVEDPDLESDPTLSQTSAAIPWNVGACQLTFLLRDSGRLAADGEDLYLVIRNGSLGTVLFRYRFDRETGFVRSFRLPIAPRHYSVPITIQASHNVLVQDGWSYVPRVVVGNAHEALVLLVFGTGLNRGQYNELAGEPVSDDARGVVLTVTALGVVRNSWEVPRGHEIQNVRFARGSLVFVGRTKLRNEPDAWDAVFALYDPDTGEQRKRSLLDFDRAEVLSDIAPLGDSHWLAAGRAGFTQNPGGGSITERATAELLILDAEGALVERLEVAQGPRHNGALSVAPAPMPGTFFVGGLLDGPGSHSADRDRSLLRSDGWVELRTVNEPPSD